MLFGVICFFSTSFVLIAAEQLDLELVEPDYPIFNEITTQAQIQSDPTWKYGGPSVADLNQDGRYELILTNHHDLPAQLFWGEGDATFREHVVPIMKHDVHGIAPGDYDSDGDVDLLISLGGGNGKKPQPPRLLNNVGGEFTDVTEASGIGGLGARGRSVRWLDIDLDGDLDMLQINAAVLVNENIPRNLLFKNIGGGKFEYVKNRQFESIDAERVLITDINSDNIPDLICFTPLSVWQGTGDFDYVDVTQSVFPEGSGEIDHVMAAADVDIDNDGDLDLYLARGKTYYELANNSVNYDAESRRLDLRDEGNKSHDGLSFQASGSVTLSHFFHWKRGVEFEPKVFLGSSKSVIHAPGDEAVSITRKMAEGFPQSVTDSGWYLGYLGDGKWRLEWRLNDNLAWGLRASVGGVDRVLTDWVPESAGLDDLLFINQQGRYERASFDLPLEHSDNNWGVTHGDFNNDGWVDLFVYRFGKLRQRLNDMMLINKQGKGFEAQFSHKATNLAGDSHGDMGAAFDYNMDGKIDILSGDDNPGRWHLFENVSSNENNYLLISVGYSKQGIDPIGAKVWVTTADQTLYRDVGSKGATHSQSILSIVHVGLGKESDVKRIKVRWRTGEEQVIDHQEANQTIMFPIESPR